MWLLAVGFAAAAMRSFSAELLHTRFEVLLEDDGAAAADAEAAFTLVRQVEIDANEWRPGSPLAAVNAAAGGPPVAVPADTWTLVERGVDLARRTGGAFDPTWAAIWDLWDFRNPKLPDAAELRRRLSLIDYTRVELAPGTIRLPEAGMRLGLGGIAKGWALDRVQQHLRAHGRTRFLVSAGGQVYAAGRREDGAKWRVGVRDPDGRPEDLVALLEVSDASVSTSGDYERFFVVDGVRYHHILDPDTGWPTRGLRATTVVSPDATLADAASTALMVAGPTKVATMAGNLGVAALWITEDGAIRTTEGLTVAWRR